MVLALLLHEWSDVSQKENHEEGISVFIRRAALKAHSSPPTQLPAGVKQQKHTQ